mgnify:CR=1
KMLLKLMKPLSRARHGARTCCFHDGNGSKVGRQVWGELWRSENTKRAALLHAARLSRPVREALMEADIVIVIMILQFGIMGQITHTQKIG